MCTISSVSFLLLKQGNLAKGKSWPINHFNHNQKEKDLMKTNCSQLSDIIHVKVSKHTKHLHLLLLHFALQSVLFMWCSFYNLQLVNKKSLKSLNTFPCWLVIIELIARIVIMKNVVYTLKHIKSWKPFHRNILDFYFI